MDRHPVASADDGPCAGARLRWFRALQWFGAAAVFFAVFSALGVWADNRVQSMACMLVLGLAAGSFVNVLVLRLPRMLEQAWRDEAEALLADRLAPGPPEAQRPRLSLSHPRSHCFSCRTPIAARHAVPVFSYLVLRGRCARCRAPFSARYCLVELACAIVWAVSGWRYGIAAEAVIYGVGLAALLALALIDWDTQLLPDALTQPLLWSGLIVSLWGGQVPPEDALMGAVLGFGVMGLISVTFRALTGEQGMGQGDIKLMAALGAWLGWVPMPGVLTLGALASVLVGVLRLRRLGLAWNTPQPFGPYLIAAGAACLFWPPCWLTSYIAQWVE